MSSPETQPAAEEKLFASALAPFAALAGPGPRVQVYARRGGALEPLREYRCHELAVTTVSFAPAPHQPFMLTAGVDMRVLLFDLEGKAAEPVFEFAEESAELGCFTVSEFLHCAGGALSFVVGTSSGAALLFSSEKAFAEQRVPLGRGSARALAAGPAQTLASVCEGEHARVFVDAALLDFVEFGAGVHDSKRVSHVGFAFAAGEEAASLLTADEEGRVGLWRFEARRGEVSPVCSFELGALPLSLCWDLSGLSATVLAAPKPAGSLACWRVEQSLDDERDGAWSLNPISLANEQ